MTRTEELDKFIEDIVEKAHKENRGVAKDEAKSIYKLKQELALKDFKMGKIKRFTGSRMTKPNETAIYSTADYYELLPGAALSKLGQLEDIEEEFGIDLISFFKTIWLSDFDEEGINHPFPVKLLESLKKNYGKTWALTREELINDKNRGI